MSLHIGIVGLPNVGKSTLFNALTRSRGARAENFPFCTIDPNIGIVEVPDNRLQKIAELVKPKKVIPATVEFKDIAGLVRGASKGEGLGNAFLSHIREVHAICHVIRAFDGGDVIHVEGSVDPKRDLETTEMELVLADLATVEKRTERVAGAARSGGKEAQCELGLLRKIAAALGQNQPARSVIPLPEEESLWESLQLLTQKPMLYAVNVEEKQLAHATAAGARELLGLPETAEVIPISAKIEEDLQDLSPEEASAFLAELAVPSSGLDRLIQAAYRALGYITFFTAGPEEVRAWTITKGACAPQAAGVIHTDFERGFICTETIAFADFVSCGGEQGARTAGKLRQEGKTYHVRDGDVMHIRFNV